MKYCTVAKARSHLEKTEKKTHGNKKEYLPVRPCTNSKNDAEIGREKKKRNHNQLVQKCARVAIVSW